MAFSKKFHITFLDILDFRQYEIRVYSQKAAHQIISCLNVPTHDIFVFFAYWHMRCHTLKYGSAVVLWDSGQTFDLGLHCVCE